MQWLVPLATGVWAVLRWTHEREQDRKRERDRTAALYVNPFLSACEDLQSRIFHIIERDGLRDLRMRYPDGSYADETLYLIVRYFGWMATVQRYGPYPHDPEMIRLTDEVRGTFSTSQYPIDAFAFFRPEQKALGKIIMERFEGQYGIEHDTIAFFDFKEQLEAPPLSESQAIKQSLDALRSARDAQSMPGRDRLARVQNLLVDILRYQENISGFRLFIGERRKCATPDRLEQGEDTGPLLLGRE